MKIGDKVFVVNWGNAYSTLTKWNDETHKRENIFPIKTEIPNYSGTNHHWEYNYEPNLTLKGTVNKREPRKLVSKTPVYKHYKWEILEIFKHPNAGEWFYPDRDDREQYGKYTEENLLLLASAHTDKDWMKCYVVISESGVSTLTPEQYEDHKFNAFIEANLNKWDRKTMIKKDVPKEIISVFYDENDRVLFGCHMTKGLVSYEYIEAKFSVDNKPIYMSSSVLYDGEGNNKCPNPELIKPFKYIKEYIEGK